MKLKKSLLPAAVLAVLGVTMAGQAHAYVYGVSKLDVSSLSVVVSPFASATITSFNFTVDNKAALNGVSVSSTGGCGGSPGLPGVGNDCTPGVGGPRADATVVNLGAPVTGENLFTVHAPGSGQHSYSDSVIHTASLTLDAAGTHTTQIAESELQTGKTASANAEIQSTTGFTFEFVISGTTSPADLTLSFLADPEMLVSILNPSGILESAQANMKFEAKLSGETNGYVADWLPNGGAGACSQLTGGATCTEIADPFNLQTQLAITTDPLSQPFNPASGLFTVNFGNIIAGTYTFSLDEVTSTSLRNTPVPESSSILMLGMGLMTLVFGARRNRKQSI